YRENQSHTTSTTHRQHPIQHLHINTSPPHPHITTDSDTHGINYTSAALDPNATTTASLATTTTPSRHQHPPNCHPP
ncbi:hypothetical protein A2U01_0069133, partial [Trifolium medium]|nr:hypothetical protein [Trifolium medium]